MNQKNRRLCPKAFWVILAGLVGAILFVTVEFLTSFFEVTATGYMLTEMFEEGRDASGNFNLSNPQIANALIIAVGAVLLAAYITFLVFTLINSAKPTSGVYAVVMLCFCTAMAVYFGALLAYHLVQVFETQSIIRLENLRNPINPIIPKGTEELLGRARMGVLIYVIGIAVNAAVGVGVVIQRLFIKSGKQYYGKSKLS